MREAGWIKDRKYLNDYLEITPDKTGYCEYLCDSVWQKYLLDNDSECIIKNYEKLKKRLSSLDNTFDEKEGLYHCANGIEGQKAGVNGLFGILPQENKTLVISPLTPDDWDYFCVENVTFNNNEITILYDKSGNVYNKSKGFFIFANGRQVFESPEVTRAVIAL